MMINASCNNECKDANEESDISKPLDVRDYCQEALPNADLIYKLYERFTNDLRFNTFTSSLQLAKGQTALVNALVYSEAFFNEDGFNHSTIEKILYMTAHILYISMLNVQSQTLGSMNAANKGTLREFSLLQQQGIMDGDSDLRASLTTTPFGLHLRALLSFDGVGFLTID